MVRMVEDKAVGIAVPDVQNPTYIETTIEGLRKEVEVNCTRLLRRARENASKNKAFRLGYWEGQINRIRKAHRTTSSIEELEKLKNKCETVLQQMEEFDR